MSAADHPSRQPNTRNLTFTCPFCGQVVWMVSSHNTLVPEPEALAVCNALEHVMDWHMTMHVDQMVDTAVSS